MKAIVIARPGGPEVLELRDVPDPIPERGEVRVRVHAIGVNRADLQQRAGFYPAPPGAPADIPGLEYAGEVDAVGSGVFDLAVGDRVFGLVAGGAYAERLVLPSRAAVKIPELSGTGTRTEDVRSKMSLEHAAAVPEACITAWDAMVTQAGLGAGERVLIHAAGSGVGTAAVQLARVIGATVLGTSRSAAKLDAARALGLAEAICVPASGEFAAEVEKRAPGGVDVVLDLVGGRYVAESVRCLAPKGRVVVVGLLGGRNAELDLGLLMHKRATVTGTVLRARPLEERIAVMRTFARHVVPLVASGAVKAVIDRTFPLAEAAAAHTFVAGNEGFGKVVLLA